MEIFQSLPILFCVVSALDSSLIRESIFSASLRFSSAVIYRPVINDGEYFHILLIKSLWGKYRIPIHFFSKRECYKETKSAESI